MTPIPLSGGNARISPLDDIDSGCKKFKQRILDVLARTSALRNNKDLTRADFFLQARSEFWQGLLYPPLLFRLVCKSLFWIFLRFGVKSTLDYFILTKKEASILSLPPLFFSDTGEELETPTKLSMFILCVLFFLPFSSGHDLKNILCPLPAFLTVRKKKNADEQNALRDDLRRKAVFFGIFCVTARLTPVVTRYCVILLWQGFSLFWL